METRRIDTLAAPAANASWPQHVCLCRNKLEGWGGAERVFIEQATALVSSGIRCTIVLFKLDEALRKRLPSEADLFVLGDCRYCDLAFFPKLLKLFRLLRKVKPDCVVAHQSMGDYLRWALFGTGIPYFLLRYTSNFYLAYDTTKYSFLFRACLQSVRNSLPAYVEGVPARWKAGPVKRLVNEIYALRDWLGVRGAREVFTLTSQSQWELQQLFGVEPFIWTPGSSQASGVPPRDEDAIRVLRDSYGIRECEPVILSVNRLEYRKRVATLIEALPILLSRGVEAKLVIVGEGEQLDTLEQQARDEGVSEAVRFVGLVSEDWLPHHYHLCDVAVSIIWGSWALSVVEPLLYNKRLVISDEIPDLLEDVPNLFRVKPEPEAVAAGLEKALAATPQDSSRLLVKQLDWDDQMDKLLERMRSSRAEE